MELCSCPPRSANDSNPVVCACLQVTEAALVEAITTQDLHTLRDVRRCTGAGDGCTCCHVRIRQLLDKHAYASSASSALPICSAK